jgi:hypothetical protein
MNFKLGVPMQGILVCIVTVLILCAIATGAMLLNSWLTVLVVNHLVSRFMALPRYTVKDGFVIFTASALLALVLMRLNRWMQEHMRRW